MKGFFGLNFLSYNVSMLQFLSSLDVKTLFLLNNLAGQSSTADFWIVFLADFLPIILVVAFAVLLWRTTCPFREKLVIGSVVFFSSFFARYGVMEVVRYFYHRPRPFLTHHLHQLLSENSYSFPSVHATFFFAFACAIYQYNKKWGIWFFILVIIMSIGRVAAGIHYPSDILGGIIVGSITAYVVFRYLRPPFMKMISGRNGETYRL